MRVAVRAAWLIVAVGVMVVMALVAIFVSGVKMPFGTTTVDRSQPVLLTSIQEISRYNAAVGNFEVIIDYEDDVNYVPGFLAGERSLFVAAGTVNAYVDFSGLADGDLTLSEDGTAAQISLPAAQLEEPNLDQDRTYLYSRDRGLANRLSDVIVVEDQQALYQMARDKMAGAAVGSDLLAQAETNTRAMLTGMFDALDIDLTITTAS